MSRPSPRGRLKAVAAVSRQLIHSPSTRRSFRLPSVKFLVTLAISLLAVAVLTALRTMTRPQVRNMRLRFSQSPADLWVKRWFVIFPMGIVANLLNPLNWLAASILAIFSAGLRALF